MSQVQGKKQEDNLEQLTANFAFLPFVVQLLSNKTPSLGVQPLPLQDNQVLTLETVESIEDIVNQAALSFLTDYGWQQRPFVYKGEERPVTGRAWHHSLWHNLSLHFTESTMDTLLIAYNMTRKAPKAAELRSGTLFSEQHQKQDLSLTIAKKMNLTAQQLQDLLDEKKKESQKSLQKLKLEANGDLLIHHMVFCRLYRLISMHQSTLKAFLRNPLNLMTHFYVLPELKETHLDSLGQLLTPAIEPMLPWLGMHWTQMWRDAEPGRWGGKKKKLEAFRQFNQNQSLLFAHWYTTAEQKERPDWLVPLLEYYHVLVHKCGPSRNWVESFRNLTQELRHVERTEYSDLWAHALMPALTLRRAYEDAHQLHPVDREPSHHLYMDAYQRAEFEQVLEVIEDLLQTLQPKIG